MDRNFLFFLLLFRKPASICSYTFWFGMSFDCNTYVITLHCKNNIILDKFILPRLYASKCRNLAFRNAAEGINPRKDQCNTSYWSVLTQVTTLLQTGCKSAKTLEPVNISKMFNSNLFFSVSLIHVCLQQVFIMLNGVVAILVHGPQ